jgi:lipopolysaccharide transport system ATP-binding protein
MSLSTVEEPKIQTNVEASAHLLDLRNISKLYHLWESPRARFIYGLWSQVPAWAPRELRTIAQQQKSKLGRDFYALQQISLTLAKGESVAILGRNGSGKSTLLQIVAGVLRPSVGTVIRNCQRVAALLELGSGFDPQFTGRENVYLNGTVLGLSKPQIDEKFSQILQFAEIDQFIDQPVKTYSSGMMVRLAFAVQVLLDPELLIIDEALAVGDIFFQQKCFAYMRQLKESGCSFLLVSHDSTAVQRFCDRGIVLVEGQKYFDGASKDAIREYRLTEKGSRRSVLTQTGGLPLAERFEEGSSEWEEPSKWFDYDCKIADLSGSQSAKLVRWSCADASAQVIDHFSPGEKIRLFVEFECAATVHDASVGFAIRDKTGQIIHAKHRYQLTPEPKIRSQGLFLLKCEFAFECRIAPGEYTLEFGLVDIGSRPAKAGEGSLSTEEFFEILCYPPAVGRFSVGATELDPIRRKSHFGLVDIDAEARFWSRRLSR